MRTVFARLKDYTTVRQSRWLKPEILRPSELCVLKVQHDQKRKIPA